MVLCDGISVSVGDSSAGDSSVAVVLGNVVVDFVAVFGTSVARFSSSYGTRSMCGLVFDNSYMLLGLM